MLFPTSSATTVIATATATAIVTVTSTVTATTAIAVVRLSSTAKNTSVFTPPS